MMEVLDKCLSLMDLTSLNPFDTQESIAQMTMKVNKFQDCFPGHPYPASICVYPNFVKTVRETLTVPEVHITSVSGAFPFSQSFPEVKVLECKLATAAGADEIDVVLPLGSFLSGQYDSCSAELKAMRKATSGHTLKVILETGVLKSEGLITKAAQLAIAAGADFIKTSTGKTETSATPFAAEVMCRCIKTHYESTGKKIGFKPAGGLSTIQDALTYMDIVRTILGEEWITPELFRFGTSRLANKILTETSNSIIIYY